jgi:hypothetical protein
VSVDDALAALETGNIAFNVPEKAKLGKPITLETKLSLRLPPTELKLLVRQPDNGQPGKVETAELKISDEMVATLEGGAAFEIKAITSVQQWIAKKQESTWRWSVTPKLGGAQTLFLTFEALLTINGKQDRILVKALEKRIDIDVGWPETWPERLEYVKKTVESISYLWGVLLVPFGAAVWRFWGRRTRAAAINAGHDDQSSGG